MKTDFIKMISFDIFSSVSFEKKNRMLTYLLKKSSSDPLYLALSRCLRNDICSGVLRSGEKLPSKRRFAKNLGISVITVENAYALLQDEGYIFSMPKRGYYVSDLKKLTVTGLKKSSAIKTFPLRGACRQALIADFRSNGADPQSFPFSIWSRIMRKVLNEKRKLLLQNSPPGGVTELREVIAQHLKDFHGMDVCSERIVVGAGTEYLIGLLIQLLGFDRTYACENPCYLRTAAVYSSFNVRCTKIDVDEQGMSAQELSKTSASVAHISPSHQFPTGTVMPISRRYELLGWASAEDERYIIEDDYDSEFRLSGRPLSTLQSIDAEGRVIYMNTFTKTLASTIRISYMVLPERLSRRFYERLAFYSCTVPNFDQYALASFITSGAFELHIGRMKKLCEQKRDLLLNSLKKSSLKDRCEVLNAKSGLHFLLRVNTDRSDEECCRRALTAGIGLSAVSQYYETASEAPSHLFVMSYTSASLERLEDSVKALCEVFL